MSMKNRKSFVRHALIALPFIIIYAITKDFLFSIFELIRLAIYIEVVQLVIYVHNRVKLFNASRILNTAWDYLKHKITDMVIDIFAPIFTYILVTALIIFIVWLV